MPLFHTIGLIARTGKDSVKNTLCTLATCLHHRGYQVISTESSVPLLDDLYNSASTLLRPLVFADDDFANHCDLIIVVGGDGTMLDAAHLVAGTDTPILGVNRGRLGFLADISPDEACNKVLSVLSGNFEQDRRIMLFMTITKNNAIIHQDVALNDVVLHAGRSVHTIDFQIQIDGIDVNRQHADGLIVATPTGSTAYSLSAGGPIIHPVLPAICIVPMHPHTLSSRPILVNDSSLIQINIHKDNRTQPMVSTDGKTSIALNHDETLQITKYHKPLILFHPTGFDFYKACRTKLNWSVYSEEFDLDSKFNLD